MAVDQYLRGRVIRVYGSVVGDTGSAADPTRLTFTLKNPSGAEKVYVYGVDGGLVKTATGEYYVDVLAEFAGRYFYRWEATSPTGADEGEYRVVQGAFA